MYIGRNTKRRSAKETASSELPDLRYRILVPMTMSSSRNLGLVLASIAVAITSAELGIAKSDECPGSPLVGGVHARVRMCLCVLVSMYGGFHVKVRTTTLTRQYGSTATAGSATRTRRKLPDLTRFIDPLTLGLHFRTGLVWFRENPEDYSVKVHPRATDLDCYIRTKRRETFVHPAGSHCSRTQNRCKGRVAVTVVGELSRLDPNTTIGSNVVATYANNGFEVGRTSAD